MKKSLLSIVGLMFSIVAFAVDGNHYNYVPKSPEAAAFDRVPDIPVSNYTGSMSFSIPIYTLECGDITLPITLDYQGNAIPVRQETTWVGLNWLLNAGGAVVTRIGGNSDYDGGAKYKEDWNNLTRNLRFYQFHVDGGEFYICPIKSMAHIQIGVVIMEKLGLHKFMARTDQKEIVMGIWPLIYIGKYSITTQERLRHFMRLF